MEHHLILNELTDLFDKSKQAYCLYLEDGKTFRYAKQLKLHNDKALQLLEGRGKVLSERFPEEVALLTLHFREWSSKWEQLAASSNFNPGDVFVFANDVTFPKQAAVNLENYYKGLQID